VDRRIQHTIALIESNVSGTFSVCELAADVHLSPSHFRHLFKRDTGATLAQFLMNERLREAGTLLETTYLSVKEIMNKVGIYDESHFAHDFRIKHGVSPSRYGKRSS
jgi:transcriptional regulator GlxA family with amidase domain